jgi:hypothetical protein
MTGLAQQAHRLVELARAEDDPSAAQLLSLHGAVAARIAAGGLAVAAATASTKAASAGAGSAGALVKGLVVSGAIATGAAGFIALQPAEPPPAPAAVAPHVAPAPVKRAPAPLPVVARAVREEEPQAPSRPAKPPSSLRLQDEAALLAEVQGALRSGQAAVALSKLESYDKRFPAGMLRSEADAARVFALCSAGRVDKARAAAARFVQRYPNAPVTARVQAACK